jgi:hypothetical protein
VKVGIRRSTRRVALLPDGGLPAVQLVTLDESFDFLESLPSLSVFRASPERNRKKTRLKLPVTVVLMADGTTTEYVDSLGVVFLGPGAV